MRPVIPAAALLIGLAAAGCGGGGSKKADSAPGCPPPESTKSAGNADVSAQAIGKGYDRMIVIRVKDKKSGVPLHGASVTVQGTMTCPHLMPLYTKDLHEASNGTYKGDYNLIMQGEWTIHIVVRSKEGGATTSALPVKVKLGG